MTKGHKGLMPFVNAAPHYRYYQRGFYGAEVAVCGNPVSRNWKVSSINTPGKLTFTQ